MKIPAAQLKEISRKLRGIGGELFNFDGKVAYSKVDNLDVIVEFPLEGVTPFGVSAEKFSQIVARLEGDVELSESEQKLTLKSKKSKLTLPITQPRPAIQIPTELFGNLLETEKLLPALNYAIQATESGSFFNYSGAVQLSKNYAAGTEGKRLAVCESGGGPSIPIILPVPAVQALKIFTGKTISVSQNEQNQYFQGDGCTLVARRLVKAFPDYEKLIPTSTVLNFSFVRMDLLSGLKAIVPLAVENQKINLTIDETECILSLDSQQGTGDITIPASGGDSFIPFSGSLPLSFLLDFVESVKENIRLGCNSEKGPFLLESGKFKLIIAGSR